MRGRVGLRMRGRVGLRTGLAGELLAVVVAMLCFGFLASAEASAAEEQLAVIVAEGTTSPAGGTFSLKTIDPSGNPIATLLSRPAVEMSGGRRVGNQVGSVSWSPDDSTVAYYQITVNSGSGIFLSPGGQLLPWDVPNLNMNTMPAWSPAGDQIAYWAYTPQGFVLRTIHPDGTGMRPVAGGGPNPAGASQPAWSPDGNTIAFSSAPGPDQVGNLLKVPAAGGTATFIAPPATDGSLVGQPAYSPDGKSIAFIRQRLTVPYTLPAYRRLVVRDLGTGAERPVTDTYPVQAPTKVSWSQDGKRIAYIEAAPVCGYGPGGCDLVTINADGTDKKIILHADYIASLAWSPATAPNYYVKHMEIAQAISPDLGPLQEVDPLSPDPIGFQWNLPSVAGSTIPLVSDKSTVLRVYVGDGSLEPGISEERYVRYSITGGTLSQPVERLDKVIVTAPDVDPTQTDPDAALNVWLPPAAARSGSAVRLDVEVNPNQEETTECAGCYPGGNKAFLTGMQFEDGGRVIIAPVPIYVIAPDQTVIGPTQDYARLWPFMTSMLPVGDSGVSSVASPAILAVNFNDLLPSALDSLNPLLSKWYACEVLLSRVEEERLMSPPATLEPGALRWVGLSSHPLPMSQCNGIAYEPGRVMVLNRPRHHTAVHELGHSLGLPHTLGYGESVASGAVALPYIGIGGAGYDSLGGYLDVFNKLEYGDVLSYSPQRWISPFTWHQMFERILAESGASASAAAANRPAAARAAAPARRSRRLVSGFIAGGRGVLLHSFVAKASKPRSGGAVIGRVVARDLRGRRIATAKVHRNAAVGSDRPSPFVVALPDSQPKRIASLALLPAASGKPFDRLTASRHAPQARFIRLPRRASARKQLKVRWRASDRDRNELSVTLLAKRGHQAWDMIAMGPARYKATIDPRALGRGKLRLQLLANDGLNTTSVKSRPVKLR
jgi:WD40-like Beta Propeller Repeat